MRSFSRICIRHWRMPWNDRMSAPRLIKARAVWRRSAVERRFGKKLPHAARSSQELSNAETMVSDFFKMDWQFQCGHFGVMKCSINIRSDVYKKCHGSNRLRLAASANIRWRPVANLPPSMVSTQRDVYKSDIGAPLNGLHPSVTRNQTKHRIQSGTCEVCPFDLQVAVLTAWNQTNPCKQTCQVRLRLSSQRMRICIRTGFKSFRTVPTWLLSTRQSPNCLFNRATWTFLVLLPPVPHSFLGQLFSDSHCWESWPKHGRVCAPPLGCIVTNLRILLRRSVSNNSVRWFRERSYTSRVTSVAPKQSCRTLRCNNELLKPQNIKSIKIPQLYFMMRLKHIN
jgi:hypothetical protein